MRAPLCAGILALAVLGAGLRWGVMVAGGSDSYGYISQAGLWRQGLPIVEQALVRESPWPFAAETWAPLGYRPSPHGRSAIVPIYAPGLPLLMTIFQQVGGYCAAFLVVPLCGALTIWLTFVIGRRAFGNAGVALAGALFVATSPTFLYQLMNAMSDVPVTAFSTLALALAVSRRPLASGLAISVATAIRPNLAPLAAWIGAWLVAVDRPAIGWFAAGVAPSIAGIAWLNAALYESALTSGYGTTEDLYALRFFVSNVRQFALSLATAEAAIVLGVALSPFARRWLPVGDVPRRNLLFGGWVAIVAVSYLFYQPFDAWWYLRFLLPLWPVAMLWCAGVAFAASRRAGVPAAFAAAALFVACFSVDNAANRSVFDLARGERRYVDVARFVAAHTEPDAVMFSVQHGGSLRWYAGRTTLRFTVLDPAWLDRAVDYLASAGRHPYFVLDGGEVDQFVRRFGAANRAGRLDWRPLATLGSVVAIYDPLARGEAPPLAIAQTRGSQRWWQCSPPYSWPPVLRMK